MVASPRVLCLGEALVDRLGPPGGDPATASPDQIDDRLGGAPANAACALARLGTTAAFVGRLGTDPIGRAFAGLFERRGVNTAALQWDRRRPSRVVLVHRDRQGERRFGGFAGDRGEGFADEALEAAPLAGALTGAGGLLGPASWLLVGTIPLARPAAAEALRRAVSLAAAAGVAIAVDVNWRPTFWDGAAAPDAPPNEAQQKQILDLLGQAALVKCAAEEARWLFGSASPEAVRQALPRHPAVVVTDGASPLRWSFGASAGELYAFPVTVADTTGAGDAFTAGVLHGLCARPELLRGEHLDGVVELMRFASACGALVCQAPGAIDPQPTAAAVAAFLAGAVSAAPTPGPAGPPPDRPPGAAPAPPARPPQAGR
ncbi:carbohydrate kinase [Cyanobium sp. NIES-981]|uniref:carbohydrate kinase family protein n=1 Tax=Cyanobium sp. NIES-981 TaxID=1851505 RepID=UPI00156020C1|nr:carbohydrate kinase [Cyanobium sp. NIES-981]